MLIMHHFDKGFIEFFCNENNINHKFIWQDTIKIFKRTWPYRKNFNLESLILDNNLASKEDHRALSDVYHTCNLLKLTL